MKTQISIILILLAVVFTSSAQTQTEKQVMETGFYGSIETELYFLLTENDTIIGYSLTFQNGKYRYINDSHFLVFATRESMAEFRQLLHTAANAKQGQNIQVTDSMGRYTIAISPDDYKISLLKGTGGTLISIKNAKRIIKELDSITEDDDLWAQL